jgi:hypothetical protein
MNDSNALALRRLREEVARLQHLARVERWGFPAESAVEVARLLLNLRVGFEQGGGGRISGAEGRETAAHSRAHDHGLGQKVDERP